MAISDNQSPEEIGLEVSLYHYLVWREKQALEFEKNVLGISPDDDVEQDLSASVARVTAEAINSDEEDSNDAQDAKKAAALNDVRRNQNECVVDQVARRSDTTYENVPISARQVLLSTKYRKVRTVFEQEFPHIASMCPSVCFAPEVHKRYFEYPSVAAAAMSGARIQFSNGRMKKRPMKSTLPLNRAVMLQKNEFINPPSENPRWQRKKLPHQDDEDTEERETHNDDSDVEAVNVMKTRKAKESRAVKSEKVALSEDAEKDDKVKSQTVTRMNAARKKDAIRSNQTSSPEEDGNGSEEREYDNKTVGTTRNTMASVRKHNATLKKKSSSNARRGGDGDEYGDDEILKEKGTATGKRKRRKENGEERYGDGEGVSEIGSETGVKKMIQKKGQSKQQKSIEPENEEDFEIDPETGERRRKKRKPGRKKTKPDKPPKPPAPPQPSFEERLVQLEHFVKGFGHSRVAPSHDAGLAHWSRRIRDNYRQCKLKPELLQKEPVTPFQLTPERLEMLNALNFEFKIRDIVIVSWDDYFSQLVQYKEMHGHCNIPKCSKENPKLAEWVKRVRHDFRRKRRLWVDQRFERLEALGFVFIPPNCKNPTFEDRVDECRDYRRLHGHLNIPRDVKNDDSITSDDRSLRQWALKIRREYRRYNDGLQSYLDKKRIRALDELGFIWTIESAYGGKKGVNNESNGNADIGSGVRRRGRPRKIPDGESRNADPPADHSGDNQEQGQDVEVDTIAAGGSIAVAKERGTLASNQVAIQNLLNEYNSRNRQRQLPGNFGDGDDGQGDDPCSDSNQIARNCDDHSDDSDDDEFPEDGKSLQHNQQRELYQNQLGDKVATKYENEFDYF